ncbi:MAG: nitroreductase family protein [Lachnospiraceae bacterium]|nr:nitroreductase family protein [Lachnospiraceae bacterium]
MEFTELIEVRRSCRHYAAEPVSHEVIEQIVRQAQMAPSWRNLQCAKSYVIESPEFLEEFRKKALPEGNAKNAENAVLIVTTFVRGQEGYWDGKPANELGDKWGAYDLGLHDAYLILAAQDAGLSSLIMGIRHSDVIREELNIPEDEDIVSVIAVGKRADEAVLRPRKPLEETVKFF